MPSKKKSKQRNSFYFFMKDMQEQLGREGRNYSMTRMSEIAHPRWMLLSLAEKEKYEKMAKDYKLEFKATGRLASDGTLIMENEREEEEREQLEKRMRQDITDMVMIHGAPKEQFIAINSEKHLYFLTFNILCYVQCVDAYDMNKAWGIYIPNEVGIVDFTIKEGMLGEYHKFIHPGAIPTGYTGEAKRHSEATHHIPISGHEDSERDYRKVWRELMDFINPPIRRNDNPVAVFCLKESMKQTLGSLEWLAKEAGAEEELKDVNVYDISYLLFELRKGVESEAASYAIAEQYLKKTAFDYIPNTRCEFHEDEDSAYCALGYAKRLSFLMSDAICDSFGVEPTTKHLPPRSYADKSYEVHLPPARNSPPPSERGVGRGFPRGRSNLSSGIQSMSLYDKVHSRVSERTDSRLHERTEPNSYTGAISKFSPYSERKSSFASGSDLENSPPGSPVRNITSPRAPTAASNKNSTEELRQPTSMSIAMNFALAVRGAPAVVPGKGIGRGQRKLQ